MPAYKLYYFNARGFAELTRLLFAQAGVEYEDIRIEREEWPAHKPNAPGGTMPYLEVDGKQLGQSMACARYVAREHGMVGKDSWEQGKIDEITDTWHDVLMCLVRVVYSERDEEKEAQKARIPPMLAGLEARLKDSNGGQGFFVGSDVSLADIKAFAVSEGMIQHGSADALDQTPLLKAHYERIAALPNIAAWLEKRPVTER